MAHAPPRALGPVLAVCLALPACLVAELPSSNILTALFLLHIVAHIINTHHLPPTHCPPAQCPPLAVLCPLPLLFVLLTLDDILNILWI